MSKKKKAKQPTAFVANEKIWAFQEKLENSSLWAWQLPNTWRLNGINKCDFLILNDEMCHQFKDADNPMNQYFGHDQCMTL